MQTIFDAKYRPPKRTVGEIFVSWFFISTVAFVIINWIQQEYGFTDVISRYISTILLSLIVAIVVFLINIKNQGK
ncbi:MAG: hypothetical protein DRN27_04140 [Thermoplasmata archaeon]|nr:MAG: hypothetical protein DRN27_04140 [Thermoplasmata archaeon]